MKILITGATGYVGSALVQALLEKGGSEIFTLDARPPCNEFKERVTHFEHDLTEIAGLDEKLGDINFDVVVHLAAKITGAPSDIMRVNVVGTENLLETLCKKKIRLLLFSSTSAQLYRNAQYIPIDERHPVTPVTPYGLSKYLAEEIVIFYHRVYGLPTLIFRQVNVYGPSPTPKATVINNFIDQAINDGTITVHGDGRQVRSFIHMSDLIQFYMRAIFHVRPEVLYGETLNISGPDDLTVKEISDIVIKYSLEEAGKKIVVRYVPLPTSSTQEIYLFKVSAEKARNLLGYKSKITAEEGIRTLIKDRIGKKGD